MSVDKLTQHYIRTLLEAVLGAARPHPNPVPRDPRAGTWSHTRRPWSSLPHQQRRAKRKAARASRKANR